MIYFTGHGGKGDKKTPQNTNTYLWNNQKVKMQDFTKRLDKLPVETPVVLVMVQCYSGGFANIIFKEGDPKKGMAKHPRAGFFATVHNRADAVDKETAVMRVFKVMELSGWMKQVKGKL